MPSQKVGVLTPVIATTDTVPSMSCPLAERRQDAKRNGDQRGDGERHQRKLDGRGQPLEDELEDVLAVAVGATEVEPHHVDQKARILFQYRPVEAPSLADARDLLLGGLVGHEKVGGIAGRDPQQNEQHECDEEEDRQDACQTQRDCPEHCSPLR